MEKSELYRYIFDNLNKGKKDTPNYEWEFTQFYKEFSQMPIVEDTVTQACKHHNSIASIEYFQKIIKQGGTDYELMIKDFIKKQKIINDTCGKKEITRNFVLQFLLFTAKIDMREEDVGKLMREIIKKNDLISTLHHCFNEVFSIFHFTEPAQLYSLLQSCQTPYLN